MANHYEILGVDANATDEEIKRAYKKLARRYHPDMNPNDSAAEQNFKDVAAAYEVLSDRERRARYDRFGTDDVGVGDILGGGLGDIFEAFLGGASMFGGSAGQRTPNTRGEDIVTHIDLDLEDVVFGGDHEVTVQTALSCETCDATGAMAGTRPTTCKDCNGSGEVRRVRQSMLGQMISTTACGVCRGAGKIIETPCDDCSGLGRVLGDRTFQVQVPVGLEDGTRLRLGGRGAAGMRGGEYGDLFVDVRVLPHPKFRRIGDDLHHRLFLPFSQMALGAEISYETLDGVETLVVPKGTESGTEFRFRNHGVPRMRSRGRGRGDLLVEVAVDVPSELDDEQDALLRQLAELRGEEVAAPSEGLFSRLKSAFTQ